MSINSKNQFRLGAIITYVAVIVNFAAGLLYTPWMVEQLGESDYGLYTLANSLISLFLIDIGLSSATSRYVAKYRAENREAEIPTFLSAVYKLYLLIDAIVFVILLVLFFCIEGIYIKFTPDEIQRLKVVFCIAGLYSVIHFPCVTFNGILTAYEKFIPLKTADLVQRLATVALTVAALSMGMGLYAMVVIHALCGLLSIAIKFCYVHKSVKIRFVRNTRDTYKSVLNFSIWSTIYGLAQRLIFNITPTILGITVSAATSAIAVFGIVTTIEGYCYTITTAINGMFLSKITRILTTDDDGARLTELATKVGRFQYALNGLIIVGFALVGQEFISLWIGESFSEAYYGILLVLIPGLLFNSLQIFHTAMIAQNMVRYQAFIQIIMGVSNVALSFVLSYFFGVIGACLSIFIAYMIRLLLTIILIKKKLKINLWYYIKNCYFRMTVPLIITGTISFFLIRYITDASWTLLVVKALIIIAIYAVAVCIFGLTKQEKQSVCGKLFKKKTQS